MTITSKILGKINNITNATKSVEEMQSMVSVAEIWNIWDHLVTRYDIIRRTDVMLNYVRDDDFKLVIIRGLKTLKRQVRIWEKMAVKYGITMPKKPPKNAVTVAKSEIIDDEYIFRVILSGIQVMIPKHGISFTQSTNPAIRAVFKQIMIEEMTTYDSLIEYGKMKNWVDYPPVFRV